MNPHLQSILSFIQESEHLSAEEKTALIKAAKAADKELEITSFKLDRTEKVKHTTAILLEETIEELEQKRKAVEAQNRELEIESALERVRTVAMSMSKADSMLKVCKIISQQLELLNVKEIRNVQTAIFYPEKGTYMNYEYYTKHDKTFITETTYSNNPKHAEFADNMQKGNGQSFELKIPGDKVKDWIAYQKTTNVFIDDFLYTASSLNYYWFSLGPVALGISTYEPLKEEDKILFKRFLKVFELAYRRYLDIEKAEAQARESQIQLALERVRARTMAMQKSEELQDVVHTLLERLKDLDVEFYTAIIILFAENSKDIIWWLENKEKQQYSKILVPYADITYLRDLFTARGNGRNHFSKTYSFEEKNELFHHLFSTTDFRNVPETQRKFLLESKAATMSVAIAKNTGIHLTRYTDKTFSEEDNEILKRFVKVFEQAYTRFLDLEKAEAQAREAEIELALERVRARTMAMQKSDELVDASDVMFNELKKIEANAIRIGICIIDGATGSSEIWSRSEINNRIENKILGVVPAGSHPVFDNMVKAWKENKSFFSCERVGDEVKEYYDQLRLHLSYPEPKQYNQRETLTSFFFSEGAINVVSLEPLEEEVADVMKRFARVFGQLYTRFLDLQKAEAQAREAQIEAALERVRSRSMAMFKSEELSDVITVVADQLQQLNVRFDHVSFVINSDAEDYHFWTALYGKPKPYELKVPYLDNPIANQAKKARSQGIKFFQDTLTPEENRQWLEHAFKYNPVDYLSPDEKAYVLSRGFSRSIAMMPNIMLAVGNYASKPYSDDDNDIIKRFASVFEQSYTRFLDLKKSEAQAREAQIEAALERVRSRTMAMQRSEELAEVATVLFQQVKALGVPQWTCGFSIFEIDDKDFTWYPGSPDGEILAPCKIPLTEHPVFISFNESRKRGDELFVYEKEGEFQADHYRYMLSLPIVGDFLQSRLDEGIPFPTFQIDHLANFSHGNLIFVTYEPVPEMHDVFKRFAKVFEQTYTRFLDLQRAEAQAREATKQASLDRVRGQIASMRSTEDLQRITPLIWHELTALDVPFIRCGVIIIDEAKAEAHIYLSSPDGHSLAAMNLPIQSNTLTANSVEYWHKGMVYREHWDKEAFSKWTQSMIELGQVQNPETYQGASQPPESLDLHFVPFTQGMMYVGNTQPLSEESIDLVKSLAEAFSIAYARYEDFTKLEKAKQNVEATLTELKATQSQLIQSEKMASLGELTAGIAHEIQNPLNFVNNFSEVNTELIDELKNELATGNQQLAMEIADDIKSNEEKINHHGKRADAIVKGMLQHSRSSTGAKEPTDINALADEYLRLAFHGLRAKDKNFNAEIKTDFDESIGKINIIPQDIGRLLLNLFNNAFYAVNQQKSRNLNSYEPKVAVSTKKSGNSVLITVSDNGGGIPKNIKEKIFQPFFTTKPTGSGTGLGLSLSYDIVKAHGGEIKVETKEDEARPDDPVGRGTEFIIQIPA